MIRVAYGCRSTGFTLVEMLLSVSIIGTLAMLSLPVYNSYIAHNDLDMTGQQVASVLRRAQVYARAMEQDSAWSVRVDTSSIILFRGTDFSTRNTAFDETVSIPDTVVASGLSEVQFSKFAALPNTTGSITITGNAGNTRVITVNAKGRVDY